MKKIVNRLARPVFFLLAPTFLAASMIGSFGWRARDPSQEPRPLTPGEVSRLFEIFGDRIQYDKTQIKREEDLVESTGASARVNSGAPIIKIDDGSYLDDYSREEEGSDKETGVFHEATHIFDMQNDPSYRKKANENARLSSAGHNVYAFSLDSSTRFSDLKIDQRANAVAMFRDISMKIKNSEDWNFRDWQQAYYLKKMLSQELPVQTVLPGENLPAPPPQSMENAKTLCEVFYFAADRDAFVRYLMEAPPTYESVVALQAIALANVRENFPLNEETSRALEGHLRQRSIKALYFRIENEHSPGEYSF